MRLTKEELDELIIEMREREREWWLEKIAYEAEMESRHSDWGDRD